eukprot:RCo009270
MFFFWRVVLGGNAACFVGALFDHMGVVVVLGLAFCLRLPVSKHKGVQEAAFFFEETSALGVFRRKTISENDCGIVLFFFSVCVVLHMSSVVNCSRCVSCRDVGFCYVWIVDGALATVELLYF